MELVRVEKVYVPTVKESCGPLVVMTRPQTQNSRALQVLAKPCLHIADVVVRTALECKKKALQVTTIVIIKLATIGKSIINFMKKDFLKKEGVPLRGFKIYKTSRGMGRMIKNTI